ncbi:MAG: geranylgeranylglycerol-phosphate geranylgeranyltransferase [Chloroflexi bacterium]|nr:MAG: geranylgeranylglycerol-phosphate geranylgeranyltransferase [Chloroflexota bacterium]
MTEQGYVPAPASAIAPQRSLAPFMHCIRARARQHCLQVVDTARLVRLSNSLPASALVLMGSYLVAGWPISTRGWIAALAMWCVTGFGYASNDYFDQTEDAINKPGRPLPAGRLPTWFAAGLSGFLALAALGLAALLGWREPVVALAVLGLLTLYNLRLKGTPAGGNLLVAMLAGGTFVTGAIAVQGFSWTSVTPVLLPATLLTFFIAAREILKTLEDMAGDRAAGKRTVAVQIGARSTVRLLAGLVVLAAIASTLPFLYQGFSLSYLLIIQAGIVAPLLFTVIYLWRQVTERRVRRCLRLLKGSYFFGLIALLVA